MFTPYMLVLTMFSGAGELADSTPHATLESCRAELIDMQAAVELAWAEHGILRTKGECRTYDPASWSTEAGVRRPGASVSLAASE